MSKTSLHILYLIDELKVQGGTESHLFFLAQGMVNLGHKVTVLSLSDGECAKMFKSLPGVTYLCLEVRRIYDLQGLLAFWRILSFVRKKGVDIIQTFHTAADIIGPIIGKLAFTGVAIISSRRDLGYTKSRRHVHVQKFVNIFVDIVLANSKAVSNSAIKNEGIPSIKTKVIYNGIKVERFARPDTYGAQCLADNLSIPADKTIIGSVGNLRTVKGYHFFVESAACLCRENSDLFFLVAGEGSIKDYLESLCRQHGIAQNFKFVGKVTRISELLSLLDIYVQPSLSEGFSNAILEAMASGLPIVATNAGGTPEIIEEGINGMLVAPSSSTGLATALGKLIVDSRLRRYMGDNAKKVISNEYSLCAMLNRYEKFYLKMAVGENANGVSGS